MILQLFWGNPHSMAMHTLLHDVDRSTTDSSNLFTGHSGCLSVGLYPPIISLFSSLSILLFVTLLLFVIAQQATDLTVTETDTFPTRFIHSNSR
jgi:hypothetical protein